jgi:hypothetical protein
MADLNLDAVPIGRYCYSARQKYHEEQAAARSARWGPAAEMIRAKIIRQAAKMPVTMDYLEYTQEHDDSPEDEVWKELETILQKKDKFEGVILLPNKQTGLNLIFIVLWKPGQ